MISSTSIRIACCILAAAIMTALALAAPMGPTRKYVPDEIQSLADLN